MKITYKPARFTAKCGDKEVRGSFTPNGTTEKFFDFLSETAKKLTGSADIVFENEKQYDWGSMVSATANRKRFVIFLHR